MMPFNILPSPTPSIVIHRYEKVLFPVFNQLFATPSSASPVRHLARNPEEALAAVILENHSEKPITAWRFRWQFTDVSNQQRAGTISGDSYAVDVSRVRDLPQLSQIEGQVLKSKRIATVFDF
jgi:hypothetical protein